MEKKKLLVFDTNSIIHRAFHALPPLKDKKGEPSGAVYGSLLAFFRFINEIRPDYVAVAFDSPEKTFRHKKYKEYKANRPKAPDELVSQIIRTQSVFSDMGVVTLSKSGLEADDIVGAVAEKAPKSIETIIVTGDMDILQLVNERTKVYTLKRGIKESVLYDREGVMQKYDGIPPEKIADMKALQGDTSDNIPGVEGIGEKTAIKIIKEYGSLEELYTALEMGSDSLSAKLKEKLLSEKRKAFLSKELSVINKKDFSDFQLSDLYFKTEDGKMVEILEGLGFDSLAKRFRKKEDSQQKKNLKLNF